MTDIGSLLRSPAWWFGAVFIALIISVIAAFLKDGISRLFSQLKRRVSVSRDKRRQEDDEYVSFLSHHPDLLSVEMQMCNLGFMRVLIVMIMLLMLPVILVFKHTFPGTGFVSSEIMWLV
jgi:hypothetical protein